MTEGLSSACCQLGVTTSLRQCPWPRAAQENADHGWNSEEKINLSVPPALLVGRDRELILVLPSLKTIIVCSVQKKKKTYLPLMNTLHKDAAVSTKNPKPPWRTISAKGIEYSSSIAPYLVSSMQRAMHCML